MRERTATLLTLGGLVCLAATVAIAAQNVTGLDAKMAALLLTPNHEQVTEMQKVVQIVTIDAAGGTVEITTTRNDGESAAAFKIRHDEAVAEWEYTG